jgi:glycosyltransferase involved in cell wall biosynthesis
VPSPQHAVHVFSTFLPGGPQVRTANLINRLGRDWRHTIFAMDGRFGTESRIDRDLDIRTHALPPRKNGISVAKTVRSLSPDLLITYNWGAIEVTAAAAIWRFCPVIHAEDGFGADEADGPKRRRALARRLFLNRIYMTVVPSHTLLNIARRAYSLKPDKVRLIVNGVDTARFQPGRDNSVRRGLGLNEDDVLFGFVGHLRKEKNLQMLLRAFRTASRPGDVLALVGDGPLRGELDCLSRELGIGERVRFLGHDEDTSKYYAAMDVFVMSSVTEQMPIALLEAMASGVAAVCTDAGDTAAMLAERCPSPADLDGYTAALRSVRDDAGLRASLAGKNRNRAVEFYSLDRMIGEYAELYSSAAGSRGCEA